MIHRLHRLTQIMKKYFSHTKAQRHEERLFHDFKTGKSHFLLSLVSFVPSCEHILRRFFLWRSFQRPFHHRRRGNTGGDRRGHEGYRLRSEMRGMTRRAFEDTGRPRPACIAAIRLAWQITPQREPLHLFLACLVSISPMSFHDTTCASCFSYDCAPA